jgi:hypothetical protein
MHSSTINTVHNTIAIYSTVSHVRSEPSDLDRTAKRNPNLRYYSYNTQIRVSTCLTTGASCSYSSLLCIARFITDQGNKEIELVNRNLY